MKYNNVYFENDVKLKRAVVDVGEENFDTLLSRYHELGGKSQVLQAVKKESFMKRMMPTRISNMIAKRTKSSVVKPATTSISKTVSSPMMGTSKGGSSAKKAVKKVQVVKKKVSSKKSK